jgi:hypothetical protein
MRWYRSESAWQRPPNAMLLRRSLRRPANDERRRRVHEAQWRPSILHPRVCITADVASANRPEVAEYATMSHRPRRPAANRRHTRAKGSTCAAWPASAGRSSASRRKGSKCRCGVRRSQASGVLTPAAPRAVANSAGVNDCGCIDHPGDLHAKASRGILWKGPCGI